MDSGGGMQVKIKEAKQKPHFESSDSNFTFFLYHTSTIFLLKLMLFLVALLWAMDLGKLQCYRGSLDCKYNADMFNTYCWVHGTHTIKRLHNVTKGTVPRPGIGLMRVDDDVVYHWEYLWIYPYLIIAYVSFRIPWWLWRRYFDGDRVFALMELINVVVVLNKEEMKNRKAYMLEYLEHNFGLPVHNRTAMRYIFCETLNFLTLLMQMWSADYLLKGEFSTYGWSVYKFVLQSNQEDRVDPMNLVFPKMTTCHLNTFGPSGSHQVKEAICVLPLNSFFEKIFVVLWFWYMFLAFASVVGIIYRFLTVYVRPFRYWLLKIHMVSCPVDILQEVCKRCSYGNWYLLFSMRNVVSRMLYEEVIEEFGKILIEKNQNQN